MDKLNLCSICKYCSLNACIKEHKFGNDNKYECEHLFYKYDKYRTLHLLIKQRDAEDEKFRIDLHEIEGKKENLHIKNSELKAENEKLRANNNKLAEIVKRDSCGQCYFTFCGDTDKCSEECAIFDLLEESLKSGK